jgi:hypothetical protein
MKQPFLQTLKSRWFAVCAQAAIWLLVILAAIGLTGKMPQVREEDSFSVPPQDPVPVSKLGHLFGPETGQMPPAATNAVSAFYTKHFVPPPVQTPPAPTTRKFELTYQGFYEAENVRRTVVKIGEGFVVSNIGGRVISNLFVADASFQALVLTNPAAQTNILILNTKKEIEVPIQ